MVGLDVAEDGCFDAAEGEVEVWAFAAGRGFFVCRYTAVAMDAWLDLAEGEGDGARVAVRGEGVDPGAARIAEAEEFCDLIVGFAGGVVDCATYVAVGPGVFGSLLLCEIQMGMAAGDYEGQDREFHGGFAALAGFHQDSVDVAFEVVDGDQRLIEAEGEGFGVGDTDQQCACEAGAFGDGNGVQVGEGDWMAGRSTR